MSTKKQELRQTVRSRLATLTTEHMALFDTQIASYFFKSLSLMPQTIISCYMPLKGEVSSKVILQTLAAQGHVICLPVTVGRAVPLIFRQYKPGDTLIRSMIGPLEPHVTAREVIPDLLIVPMLGFNRSGNRLGYGTGLYDRTLEALRKVKPIKAIGVAYSIQEFPELPVEDHDEKIDLIITEKEIIGQ